MPRKTSIEVIDEELWYWARYRARTLKLKTSQYIFKLIGKDRKGEIKWQSQPKRQPSTKHQHQAPPQTLKQIVNE